MTCAQLLNEYSPIAAGMLSVLVPAFEPMGWGTREPGTLLGFEYTWPAIAAIAVSAVLGLLVSLSTFLVRAGLFGTHGRVYQPLVWSCCFLQALQQRCHSAACSRTEFASVIAGDWRDL